jgi:hypothetical protein
LQTKTQYITASGGVTNVSGNLVSASLVSGNSLQSVTSLTMSNVPKFSVYHLSSNQTISAGSNVICLHNTSEFNIGSCYNATTGKFQPTTAGYYSISGSYFIGATNNCSIQLWKNGVEFYRGDQVSVTSSGDTVNISNSCLQMNGSTDYIQIVVFSIVATSTLTTTRSLQTFQGTYLHS